MASDSFEILAADLSHPAGCAFDTTGKLWCVETRGAAVVCLHGGQQRRLNCGGSPASLIFDWMGRGWVCDTAQNSVRCFSPVAGEWAVMADAVDREPLEHPSDLAFDPAGNLLITCAGAARGLPNGALICRQPSGVVSRIASGMFSPSGIVLADGGDSLIIAETHRHRLWKGEWDCDHREWLGARPFAELGGPTGPMGMALAADGNLYVAMYGAGLIKVVAPNGNVVQTLNTGGANPTHCAFDPAGELGLVVTESQAGRMLSFPGLGPRAPIFGGRVPLRPTPPVQPISETSTDAPVGPPNDLPINPPNDPPSATRR